MPPYRMLASFRTYYRHLVHGALGSYWMLLAGLGFALMGACVKAGAARFNPGELVFYRSLFGLISISLLVQWQRKSLRTAVLGCHLRRSALGGVALVLFFYAIAHLPLATAITLNYTSPLFLALLSPWLLAQERPVNSRTRFRLSACIVVGFIGVCLLLQPVWQSSLGWAGIAGLCSGLGAALAYVHVKQLGLYGEPDWRTVFYFTLVCTLGSGLWMLGQRFTFPGLDDLPLLLALGASATLSQLAMTRAYRTGQTLTVASLAYSTVVFATLLGVWVWHEPLTGLEVLAMLLIIVVGILSSYFATPTAASQQVPSIPSRQR